MRQGTNGRRPRGRPNRKQHGGAPRSNSFDSNGPEGRVRGNAHQVYEKYLALARDAVSAGDRVQAETYQQYAEHYYRILNSSTDPQPNGHGQAKRQGWNGRDGDGPFAETRDAGDASVAGLRPVEAEAQAPAQQPAPEQRTGQPRRRPRPDVEPERTEAGDSNSGESQTPDPEPAGA